ncbi:MAG: ATPase, T2SS/T4P/T4SS family [Planctomycetota bacterium]|jgi:type II secretory ATPase GspE/PulE/Tfp pilus assembly ATPase PilB-like protein
MLDLLSASIEYGGYISIIKLIGYIILFFGWLPLVGWIHYDAKTVETNDVFWTGIILGAGAAGAIIWLLIPIFLVGMLFYLIAVGAISLAYVKHRNTRVLDFDKVLTIDHMKNLFVSKEKKLEALKSFTFVTSNKNEIPVPEPRTPEFFGYKTAYEILSDATWRRASSIVFSPTAHDYQMAYNVDGTSLKQPSIARDQMQYFIHFVKELAGLDTKEKRKPQKGNFKIRKKKDDIPWEVTTAGSTAGEQVRLKPIAHEVITRITDIGLMPEQESMLNQFREVKQGVFIISGPRKNGITTTLYALLRNHDAFVNSINTLERQPSTELPNITQNVFNGKLVYITLKADSVIQALGKWLKYVGNKSIVADTLLGISNQRLLRILCDECKQAYAPDKELFKKFNIAAEKTKVLYRAGKVQYDKHGKPLTCEHCQGTGHYGRTGVFEIITLNNELRKVVNKSKSLPEIGTQFRRAKMLYLQEQALRKVIAGKVAINEMIRVLSASKTKQANTNSRK